MLQEIAAALAASGKLQFAPRQPQSPLFATLGAVVSIEHPDAIDYLVVNAAGDNLALLRRTLEKNLTSSQSYTRTPALTLQAAA